MVETAVIGCSLHTIRIMFGVLVLSLSSTAHLCNMSRKVSKTRLRVVKGLPP